MNDGECPMPRVAISYRRTDSDAITGRIFDRLVARYGSESVFRDIDSMPAGVDLVPSGVWLELKVA